MKSVLEHGLTARETARLVPIMLRKPKTDHERILSFPGRILSGWQPVRPVEKKPTPSVMTYDALLEIERILKSKPFDETHFSRIDKNGLRPIQSAIVSGGAKML